MKHFLFFILMVSPAIFFISCGDEDDTPMDTEWILVEQLIDPGDGSGEYMSVQSDKTIMLKTDSTFTSNGDVCTMSLDASTATAGTFDADIISPDNCNANMIDIRYEISGDEMILSYPCIEPCGHKYERK